MVRVSSLAKLRPWSELTAKMVMGVVPGLVILCLHFQGNTPWVAPACADCPGFLVLGFCSCPGFHLGLGASDCSPGLEFCFTGPWTLLGSAARSYPTTSAKTGRTAHVFTAQGRHAPT